MKRELFQAIESLPTFCDADGASVMRTWTHTLPRRHQGVLVTAIRGCDGAPKDDASKVLSCMIRRAILNPADPRETTKERGFFGMSHARLKRDLLDFLHSLDQYPLHYVMHLCHASEVIGYKHPEECYRQFFSLTYAMMVYKFHLRAESESEMDTRLTLDRIVAGTKRETFRSNHDQPPD